MQFTASPPLISIFSIQIISSSANNEAVDAFVLKSCENVIMTLKYSPDVRISPAVNYFLVHLRQLLISPEFSSWIPSDVWLYENVFSLTRLQISHQKKFRVIKTLSKEVQSDETTIPNILNVICIPEKHFLNEILSAPRFFWRVEVVVADCG